MYYITGTHSYSFLIQREPIDLEAIQGYLFEPDVAVEEQDNDDIVLREQQRQEVCDFNQSFQFSKLFTQKIKRPSSAFHVFTSSWVLDIHVKFDFHWLLYY